MKCNIYGLNCGVRICHVIKLISTFFKGDMYLIMSYILFHSDINDMSWSVLEAINNRLGVVLSDIK